MSPLPQQDPERAGGGLGEWTKGHIVSKPSDPNALILEAWAQGYLVGSLIIMAFITLANMRRGVLLHKVSFLIPNVCIH